jgi:NitT/TauT family transport system substrate-binding protein
MMSIMSKDDEAGKAARTAMATASGTDLAGYDAQLATTQMFYTPKEAVEFTKDGSLPKTMTFVAKFLFDHGILGEGAPSADYVGVAYPSGEVTGDKNNVKLRYDMTYMEMAADGKL